MLPYKPIYWLGIQPFLKQSLLHYFSKQQTKSILLKTKVEYQYLLNQTYDTGAKNPMSANLYFMLIFLALYKANPNTINKELLKKILHEDILSNNALLKLSGVDYNNPKDLEAYRKKMKENEDYALAHQDIYPELWLFHVDDNKHQDGIYFEFSQCPIAKFVKECGMEDVTPIFCECDHLLLQYRKAKLYRTKTIAKGDGCCDFWVVGDQVSNPK